MAPHIVSGWGGSQRWPFQQSFEEVVCVLLDLLEFGMQALACEQAWFSIIVLRDTEVEKLEGGIPQLTAEVLYSFFDAERHDISIAGVSLKLHGDGKRIHIWSKFGMLLGGEPALKDVLGCKGYAGVNICCMRINCVVH